jgi:hypothetical protein
MADNGATRAQSARNLNPTLKSDSKSTETHEMSAPINVDESESPRTQGWAGDNRRDSDRRQQPTRPWSHWLGPLRRATGRRSMDRRSYVDVYNHKDVALLLMIFLLNLGDAFFTMLWLDRGGGEANPVMNYFLEISPGAFIAQKCFVVGLWLVVLVVHKNFRFARLGLKLSLGVYALLLLVHFGIIAFDISPSGEIEVPAGISIRTMP